MVRRRSGPFRFSAGPGGDYASCVLPRLVLAIVSGLVLTAAFEPLALPYLLPVGVAGFAVATTGLPVLRAGVVGLAFGVAFYFTHIDWMRTSTGVDAWIALSAVEALFYGLVGLTVPLLHRLPWWPAWLAAAWTAMEGVRSTWPFSGMPWGRLAFAAADTPVAPALAYVGMTGLSFLLALLGFLLADAVVRRRVPALVAPVGLAALLVVPAVRPYDVDQEGTAVVAAVQGDVPGPGDDILWDHRGVTRNHVEATEQLAADVAAGREPRPDFVLWPENSTAVDPFADSEVNGGIRDAVRSIGVPVVVGGLVDDGPDHVLNQGIVWDPVSGPGDRYTKHHPVAYGEYIPYRRYWDPGFGDLSLISRDMKSGTRTEPLQVAGVEVADAICFDVAYDDVMRSQVADGAEMLAVQTSNAMFIFTDQVDQQFAITRLRAIESGRWLAVAATNGITGIVAPDGTVVSAADRRSTAVLVEEVGLSTDLTPAVRLGPWPSRLFTSLAVLGLVLGGLAHRRGRKQAGSARPDAAPEAAAEPAPPSRPSEAPVG